jgi:hypothetical protein
MRKTYLLTAIVLLSTHWVMAQSVGRPSTLPDSPSSYQQPVAPATVAASSTQSPSATRRDTFLEGCIGGSSGRLTLTDAGGKVYQLRGETTTLAEHIGQHATITGIDEQESVSDADKAQHAFTVKKVAFIARICPASK